MPESVLLSGAHQILPIGSVSDSQNKLTKLRQACFQARAAIGLGLFSLLLASFCRVLLTTYRQSG